jgi:chaperonin GroEL
MDKMTRLLQTTYGPSGRTVIVAPPFASRSPEVLDSAATVARRTLGIGDPFEDMGAMLIRHLAWRVFKRVGDGTALAAVLARAIVEDATRLVSAGIAPTDVKRGLERGLTVATDSLRAQAGTVDDPELLERMLLGSLGDADLARRVADMVDAVGPDGYVQVEDSPNVHTTSEHIDGVRWAEGYVSPNLVSDGETAIRMVDARILVTDHHIESPQQLGPTLEACVKAGARRLFIVAGGVAESVIGAMVMNRQNGVFDEIAAAKAPLIADHRQAALADLAALTGGRYICSERFDRIEDVSIEDLGRARHAWATHTHFGIVGGDRDPEAVDERIVATRAALDATTDDDWARERTRERLGKLSGQHATVRVGGLTPSDRDDRKLRVEAAVASAQSTLQHGAVAGGGAALLAASLAVRGDGGGPGLGVLARALEAPMRALAANAGVDGTWLVGSARGRVPAQAFDVVGHRWLDPWEAGLLDPIEVVLVALESAVSAGSVALTSDVLIHRADQSASVEP